MSKVAKFAFKTEVTKDGETDLVEFKKGEKVPKEIADAQTHVVMDEKEFKAQEGGAVLSEEDANAVEAIQGELDAKTEEVKTCKAEAKEALKEKDATIKELEGTIKDLQAELDAKAKEVKADKAETPKTKSKAKTKAKK